MQKSQNQNNRKCAIIYFGVFIVLILISTLLNISISSADKTTVFNNVESDANTRRNSVSSGNGITTGDAKSEVKVKNDIGTDNGNSRTEIKIKSQVNGQTEEFETSSDSPEIDISKELTDQNALSSVRVESQTTQNIPEEKDPTSQESLDKLEKSENMFQTITQFFKNIFNQLASIFS